jgi:hypothetical protein
MATVISDIGIEGFRLQKNQGHCHCLHPDIEVSGEPGWATLRRWWDTCKFFEITEG